MEVFNSIPVDLETNKVLKFMRMRGGNQQVERMVQELVEVTRSIAKPKVVYKVSYVDNKDGDTVTELEEVAIPSKDLMKSFCFDAIKTIVLRLAVDYVSNRLIEYYALGKMSHMNPGSLESWPITQQKELFSLFGSAEELIGVRLTKSCVMFPLKSVSGIYFPTEIKFESCQLCPREKCIGRRAPYDPELARKYREDTV